VTDDEYRENMATLESAARNWTFLSVSVSDGDLAVMAETVERADSFGAILDPTMYRKRLADGGLDRQRKLIAATRAYRKAIEALDPDAALLRSSQDAGPAPETEEQGT